MSRSAFFYGTLMHPDILKRVIGQDCGHLRISSSVLMEYTRHCVKGADYPGITAYTAGRIHLFNRDLSTEERCVRGTLVTGLTDRDMKRLDRFEDEGQLYDRKTVQVHLLSEPTPLTEYDIASNFKPTGDAQTLPVNLPPPVTTETYVFCDVTGLESELWSFEDFVKTKALEWI